MPWTKLATMRELPPGALIEAVHEGELYALCHTGGEVRAIGGRCPHNGGPLGQGTLQGDLVVCPWHTWEFDSATGACVFNDRIRVETYSVRIDQDDVLVEIPGDA